jgi:hypothetical protein
LRAFTHLHQLEILLGISLLLSFFSWGKRLLFPFQIFTTWIHECAHAVMAVLMGGGSIRITLAPDGSGLTHYSIPKSKFRHAMVASAGYLGASATGCLLFFLSQSWNARSLIFTLCSLIVFTLVIWIRNGFGWVSVAILGAGLGALCYPVAEPYANTVLTFLGIQTALNALFDLRQLFSIKASGGTVSDAHTLQKIFYLPAFFWAFLWLLLSMAMMYGTLKWMHFLN